MGELLAKNVLLDEGYDIIEENFTCRLGEVDLIATRGDELIFTEVKTRLSDSFGRPAEAVDRKKKLHLINSANYYIKTNPNLEQMKIRFTVVEIMVNHMTDVF